MNQATPVGEVEDGLMDGWIMGIFNALNIGEKSLGMKNIHEKQEKLQKEVKEIQQKMNLPLQSPDLECPVCYDQMDPSMVSLHFFSHFTFI